MVLLPSSPPLRAMDVDDVPSSPPLPAALAVPPSRKRQLSAEYDLSSDPLFSEGTTDSEDAGCDRPRRKRMVRGPWWSMGKRPQREGSALKDDSNANATSRNVDSGIWMGSDGSEGSSLSLSWSRRRLQALRVATTTTVDTKTDAKTTRPATVRRARPIDKRAEDIVNECVDQGKEAVDLSNLDLQVLSPETLRPLHQLIRHAHITSTEPPSEDEFTTFTPSLKLFLAGNQLTSLPSELFLLENTTVLSLRNNILPELPHSIERLRLLQELNIAGNQIRYLPYELLALLGRTKQVNVRPNPLLQISGLSVPPELQHDTTQDEIMLSGPDGAQLQNDSISIRLNARLKLGRSLRAQDFKEKLVAGDEMFVAREELIYLASSSVRYFDVVGLPCQTSDAPYDVVLDALPASSSSKSPSLFETVLQCAQRQCDLDSLPAGIPTVVSAALEKAAKARDVGNQKCTTCHREFIIPRAEWMEFWFSGLSTQEDLTSEAVLPFIRKACSRACAQPNAVGCFK